MSETDRLIPKNPPPDLRVYYASANHPQGAPGTNPQKNVVFGWNSCWVASALSLLANQPLIALFVNSIYREGEIQGNRISVVPVNPPPPIDDPQRTADENKAAISAYTHMMSVRPMHLAYTIDLIEMLWLINNGTPQRLAACNFTFFNTVIRMMSGVQQSAHHKLVNAFADAVTDAYNVFYPMILDAMSEWWHHTNKAAFSLFNSYGHTISVAETLAPVGIGVVAWSKDCYIINERGRLAPSISIDFKNDDPMDLNYEISHNYFNKMEYFEKKTDTVHKQLLEKNDGITEWTKMRSINALPWRFSVYINRQQATMVHNRSKGDKYNYKSMKNELYYNPTSLIIGPTSTTSEWARYRLVGRIMHNGTAGNGGHYTSNIMRNGVLINLDFDTITRETELKLDGSIFADTQCCLLEFEQCE